MSYRPFSSKSLSFVVLFCITSFHIFEFIEHNPLVKNIVEMKKQSQRCFLNFRFIISKLDKFILNITTSTLQHNRCSPWPWTSLSSTFCSVVSSKLITISDFWIISLVFVAYRCNTLHYHHSSSSGTNALPWCLCENPEYLSPTELGSSTSKKILINLVFVCFFFQPCLAAKRSLLGKFICSGEKNDLKLEWLPF